MSVALRNRPVTLKMSEIKEAERVLRQYPYFSLLERRRREEILQGDFQDDNVGGSRSIATVNHGHENMVIRIAEDEVIKAIKHNRKAIEMAMEDLEPYQRKIVEMSYFRRFNKPDADRIATLANVGRSTVFRFRKDFITYIYPRLSL